MTGKREGNLGDFHQANKAANLENEFGNASPFLVEDGIEIPCKWHHLEDMEFINGDLYCTRQLVRSDVHTKIQGMGHVGTVGQLKVFLNFSDYRTYLYMIDMKNLEVIDFWKPIPKGSFDTLNSLLGKEIPSEFSEFFSKYNGAIVLEDTFGKYMISSFLQFEPKRDASVFDIVRTYKIEMGIDYLIPFATDSGGWVFCYSISPDSFGNIFIDKFESGEENAIEKIADSLEDFVNGLKEG